MTTPAPYRPTPDRIPDGVLAPREYVPRKRQKGDIMLAVGIAMGLLVLALIACANWARVQTEKRAEIEGRFTAFRAGVEERGRQAENDAKKKAEMDRKLQEAADAENRNTIADLRARIKRMRDTGANTSGGSLSTAPAGSRCPEGQTCFDTALYRGAVRGFIEEIRRLADEGAEIAADLETARKWAASQ